MKRLKRQQRRTLVSLVKRAAIVQEAIRKINESAARYLCTLRPEYTIEKARRAIARRISEDERRDALTKKGFNLKENIHK